MACVRYALYVRPVFLKKLCFFQIFVVGILPPAGFLNQSELIDIAGDPERVIIAVDGFDSLDDQFTALLANELCPAPCT